LIRDRPRRLGEVRTLLHDDVVKRRFGDGLAKTHPGHADGQEADERREPLLAAECVTRLRNPGEKLDDEQDRDDRKAALFDARRRRAHPTGDNPEHGGEEDTWQENRP
jgi:hypothetical protein